ncbi:MAG: hypothetical protein IPN72_16385 [Saprospiraceae bacterium]|nr:hypothetical protein [Saprospiraceae bacterium]
MVNSEWCEMGDVRCEMFEALLVELRHALASQLEYSFETQVEKGLAPFFSKGEILIGEWLS